MSGNCPAIGDAVGQIPAIQSLTRTYCAIGQRPSSEIIDTFTTCCHLGGDTSIQIEPLVDGCYQWCQLPNSYFAKKHAGENVTQNFLNCLNDNGGYRGAQVQCNSLGSTNDLQTGAATTSSASWFKVSGVLALVGSLMLL